LGTKEATLPLSNITVLPPVIHGLQLVQIDVQSDTNYSYTCIQNKLSMQETDRHKQSLSVFRSIDRCVI